VYLRSQLYTKLVVEFETDVEETENAIDKFLQVVETGKYSPAVILASGSDPSVEGDIEEDAEHVYSTQVYWNFEYPGPEVYSDKNARGVEVIELPHEDKLLREDDEK
jgi:hypothetical protein